MVPLSPYHGRGLSRDWTPLCLVIVCLLLYVRRKVDIHGLREVPSSYVTFVYSKEGREDVNTESTFSMCVFVLLFSNKVQ